MKLQRCLVVYFHNGGGYDFHFLLRTICRLRHVPEPPVSHGKPAPDEPAEDEEDEEEPPQ